MIELKDTVQIVTITTDGYGGKSATVLTTVDALFLQSTSSGRSNNAEIVQADSHVYLDPQNSILQNKGYRIEGMYLIANPFGPSDEVNWYKITRVVVGQRKLLDNDVDNIHAFLEKVAPLEVNYVS